MVIRNIFRVGWRSFSETRFAYILELVASYVYVTVLSKGMESLKLSSSNNDQGYGYLVLPVSS